MKNYKAWCVCLLAWIISCTGTALAQSRYDELCAGKDIKQEEAVAWIEIPEADFKAPVMQSTQDDTYYSDHDAGGAEAECGALYTQAEYNAADFADPVTIIYGSSRREDAPFRNLQELYSGQFEKCQSILIHLPDRTLAYEVFAAIPYSSTHILHYYDFENERRYTGFFDGVYSTRRLGMHLAEENRPEFGDGVLILSTGLRGDPMQRYLVMGKLVGAGTIN